MSILGEGFHSPGGRSRNRPHGNLNVLRVAVLVLFGILTARLGYMQLIDGATYAARARDNQTVEKNILPTRGLILDRNGVPLVQNAPVYTVSILPELLPDLDREGGAEKRYRLYLKLEQITGVSALDIQARVDAAEADDRGYIAISIQKYLTSDQALTLRESAVDMPGVSLDITPGRTYPAGPEFSHILGYIGPQFAEDFAERRKEGYQSNEPIGKDGLEGRYEKDLRGQIGYSANEQDASGRLITELQSKEPVPGNTLNLAIDAELQTFVAELLQDSMGEARVAAAVVMKANTGEVVSIVSIPTYDNNIFTQLDAREAEYTALNEDPRKPLLNWALSSAAPGSVFKLVTAAAGLEEGNITANTGRTVDSRRLEIKGETGEIFEFLDWAEHGYVDLRRAIARSSNIYFYMTAGGIAQEGSKGLGKDIETSGVILGNWARKFGFGQPTGIDIYGESEGRVPTPEWKKRAFARLSSNEWDWFLGDTYFTAIGQGDVLATPMQVARMTAAVANGGKLPTPRVVNSVTSPDGATVRTIQPEMKEVGVSAENLQVIREGMLQSVNTADGAGARARLSSVTVAGKTGTAEFTENNVKLQHAWFTGFAPYEAPEIVVTVYFDIGVGGDNAAPVAGRIIDFYMKNVAGK